MSNIRRSGHDMNLKDLDFLEYLYRDNNQRKQRKREIKEDLNLIHFNLNNLPIEKKLIDQYYSENSDFKKIFIVGIPRSGTTLLTQMLYSTFNVSIVNNFVSKFFLIPIYGIQQFLELKKNNVAQSSFKSVLGNTLGLDEPHEFGYFWQYYFRHSENDELDENELSQVDWQGLDRHLTSLCNSVSQDFLFKNPVFHNYKIGRIVQEISNSRIIYLKRNLVDIGLSIYNARLKMYGDSKIWWSIKPHDFLNWRFDNPIDQICKQILNVRNSLEKQLKGLEKHEYLILDYDKILMENQNAINPVGNFLAFRENPVFENPVNKLDRIQDIELRMKFAERLDFFDQKIEK